MVDEQDPKVVEFRIRRIRRAPRNWTYWISVFTAVNALLIWLGEDTVILAGLVGPFMASGPLPHVIMALLFLALARFSERFPQLLIRGFRYT